MASRSAKLSLDEIILELRELRKLLIADRREFSKRRKQLNMENQRLRTEKKALLDYIKELEKFSVDKIDVEDLKDKLSS